MLLLILFVLGDIILYFFIGGVVVFIADQYGSATADQEPLIIFAWPFWLAANGGYWAADKVDDWRCSFSRWINSPVKRLTIDVGPEEILVCHQCGERRGKHAD